ncbi:hypothetical protein [Antiquaquibacter soli]|uniref:Uncharacterized protein n=1 Tax=Antiquaquibacter soli TaxID=3064523 RepID=A0ABT9BP03_9MICO|nr:hypothetical protein [Protaetiibacter sp. WY-16]MDO7882756.1 hypothetical protein [Protaetiibacter sp. WY-16]
MDEPDLMSARAEVQRTDRTGTIWFAAALVAVTLFVASLVLSGWRPSLLPAGAAVAWWIGFALAALGLAGIGYAGCPIYWGNVEVAHWQKSVAIRAGLVLFLIGGVTVVVSMLAG